MKIIRLAEQATIQAAGYTKQILADSEALQCPGARVQVVTIQPGDTIEDHYHRRAHEFYYILQGTCRLTVNGQTRSLAPGDMLLMEPGDVHNLSNPGSAPFRVLVFKTNGDDDTHWPS
jgi:quercetin dioxygenase-like cupin family protein